ncbi:MAG: TetR family transcriptional regulator [Prevotellaceae bacterium]|jgi:AcrR family transcriptional regulator|nr:TetR family transcriptional regulator [Prevotellaceae bacterium]
MAEDIKTEEKIKNAAIKLFQQRGFAGTKTRDIAQEAGINIALLNYYFRSKEKLFDIVMEESLRKIFFGMRDVFKKPTFEDKLEGIVNNYIDVLQTNPDLPLFVFSEIQAGATGFLKKAGIPSDFIFENPFMQQLKEELKVENPLQIILNILALVIFPFLAKPLWMRLTDINEDEFAAFIEERRSLIPGWIKLIINTNTDSI